MNFGPNNPLIAGCRVALIENFSMHTIMELNKARGNFFFSDSTTRFFDSTYPGAIYGAAGMLFVTRDKRGFRNGGHGYTVRRCCDQCPDAGDNGYIERVSDFLEFDSESQAFAFARQLHVAADALLQCFTEEKRNVH